MKILSIAFNFNELKHDLKELSKQYETSAIIKDWIKGKRKLEDFIEDINDYNKKYIIYLTNNYITFELYENYCLNYLNKK